MQPSNKCLDLIKRFEGCRLEAYKCPAGLPTIGYGRTTNVSMGDSCTQEQADAWLTEEANDFGKKVAALLKVPVTQNQFDALVCFAYNVGIGNLKSSTLLKMINDGQADAAGSQFLRWNKANGKVLSGLVNRRQAEMELFNAV